MESFAEALGYTDPDQNPHTPSSPRSTYSKLGSRSNSGFFADSAATTSNTNNDPTANDGTDYQEPKSPGTISTREKQGNGTAKAGYQLQAASDFAPIHQKVSRRSSKSSRSGSGSERMGWSYSLMRWPLLVSRRSDSAGVDDKRNFEVIIADRFSRHVPIVFIWCRV